MPTLLSALVFFGLSGPPATAQTDGSPDTLFGASGRTILNAAQGVAAGVGLQSDQKIILMGHSGVPSAPQFAAWRVTTAGALDGTFGTAGVASFTGTGFGLTGAVQPDNKIVVAGFVPQAPSGTDLALVRFNANGTVDTGFGTMGRAVIPLGYSQEIVDKIFVLPDGKILLLGDVYNGGFDLNGQIVLVRLNADGTRDTSFDGDGKAFHDFSESGTGYDDFLEAVRDADGGIRFVGNTTDLIGFSIPVMGRFNSDGSRDTTFGVNGFVTRPQGTVGWSSIGPMSESTFLVAGATYDIFGQATPTIFRFNPNGSVDMTFGTAGVRNRVGGTQSAVHIMQPDKKTLLLGPNDGSANTYFISRLVREGGPDTSLFGGSGVVSGGAFGQSTGLRDAATQTDGKLLVVGETTLPGNNVNRFPFVARYFIAAPPTSGTVQVRGRVLTAEGNALAKARVIMTDGTGAARASVTNAFGYFSFDAVRAGESCIIAVESKRRIFVPQVINVTDGIGDLTITSLP